MKIGIFGGTFNPIHYGHLRAVEEAGEKFGLDRILFIPAGKPPLKSNDLAEAAHRYAMVRLAVKGNPLFEVLDIECRRAGKSYTVNTLEQLRRTYPDADFFFILGIDAFLDIPNWREPEKILSLANFIVLSRPGRNFSDLLQSPYLHLKKNQLAGIDSGTSEACTTVLQGGRQVILSRITPLGISSTDIRNQVKSGTSIKYLLPARVESYIISNNLYGERNERKRMSGRRECL